MKRWFTVIYKGCDVWHEVAKDREEAVENALKYIEHLTHVEKRHVIVSVELVECEEYSKGNFNIGDSWEIEDILHGDNYGK